MSDISCNSTTPASSARCSGLSPHGLAVVRWTRALHRALRARHVWEQAGPPGGSAQRARRQARRRRSVSSGYYRHHICSCESSPTEQLKCWLKVASGRRLTALNEERHFSVATVRRGGLRGAKVPMPTARPGRSSITFEKYVN